MVVIYERDTLVVRGRVAHASLRGFGFRFQDFEFRVWGSGLGFGVSGFEFRVSGFRDLLAESTVLVGCGRLAHAARRCLMDSQVKNNYFTKLCSNAEQGSYLWLIDFCITQL